MLEFPLRLTPGAFDLPRSSRADELFEWARASGAWLADRLVAHGAVLFRGFDLDSAAFTRLVDVLDPRPFEYIGGISPRRRLGPSLYESTAYPPSLLLQLHNELPHTLRAPERLWFLGVTPPDEGGETIIADARALCSRLDPGLRAQVEAAGVGYFWTYVPRTLRGSSMKSWPESFATEDRDEVAKVLTEQGFRFGFRDSGMLWTYAVRDGVIDHPRTAERTWWNQIDLRSPPSREEIAEAARAAEVGPERSPLMRWCGFGDGTGFDADALGHLRDVSASLTHPHRWERGDMLALDNAACQHGRSPFAGTREVLVRMTGVLTARPDGPRA